MSHLRAITFVAMISLFAVDVSAEVSDKIPSALTLWVEGVGLALVALLMSRRNALLGLFPSILGALLLLGTWDMFQDDHMAVAIRTERGPGYVLAVWMAPALPILVTGIALVRERMLKRRPQ